MTEEQERYLDDSYDRFRDDKLTEESETASLWYESLGDKEQDDIRYAFKEHLYDMGYSRVSVEMGGCDDGRDERLKEEYKNQ